MSINRSTKALPQVARSKRLTVPVLAALVILAGACSGSADSTSAVAGSTPTEPTQASVEASTSTTPITTEVGPTTTAGPELEIVTFRPPDLGESTRALVTPALGGLRFSVDETHYVFVTGDSITVAPGGWGPDTNESSNASLALISATPDGAAAKTVERYINQVESIPGHSIEPTGTAIELFGYTLAGYDVSGPLDPGRIAMFANNRLGAATGSVVSVAEGERVFLAETPSGVLLAGFDRENEEAENALATLLDTAELTGPGFDPALPTGSRFGGGGQSSPMAADQVDGGPPVLLGAFSPIEAGAYQLPNFGLPVSIDIPAGWHVQPNSPGIVVLSREGSRGPGDRGINLVTGVIGTLAPAAGGPSRVGPSIVFDTVGDLIDAAPVGIEISNVTETTLAGQPVTRFDVKIADDVSCAQDDPCQFALETGWGFWTLLQSTHFHRLWWFDGHPAGRAFIIAADIRAEFIDEATLLVESIQSVG